MAVFDAHPANFLRDRNGIILPIDAVVLRADDKLAKLLGALLKPWMDAGGETPPPTT